MKHLRLYEGYLSDLKDTKGKFLKSIKDLQDKMESDLKELVDSYKKEFETAATRLRDEFDTELVQYHGSTRKKMEDGNYYTAIFGLKCKCSQEDREYFYEAIKEFNLEIKNTKLKDCIVRYVIYPNNTWDSDITEFFTRLAEVKNRPLNVGIILYEKREDQPTIDPNTGLDEEELDNLFSNLEDTELTETITEKEIADLINDGGYIWTEIIEDLPNNDPEKPLIPKDVQDGNVLAEYDGKLVNVRLDNITKVSKTNESIHFGSDFDDFLSDAQENDIVARILSDYQLTNFYDDDEDLNYISMSNDDKIRYTPKKYRDDENYEGNFNGKVEVKIGRAVNKILKSIKDGLDKEVVIIPNYLITVKNNKIEYPERTILIPKNEIDEKSIYSKPTFVTWELERLGQTIKGESELFEIIYGFNEELIFDPSIKIPSGKYAAKLTFKNFLNPIKDKDVENFVNKYKAFNDIASNKTKFEVWTGEKIKDGYKTENYLVKQSVLGKSCMNNHQDYLDIYSENEQVSLLVLLDSKTDLILGRSLMWDCSVYETIDDFENENPMVKKAKFLDRSYVTHDKHAELFYKYAKKNKYYYRTGGTADAKYMDPKGKELDSDVVFASFLDDIDFESYPYIDTFSYLSYGHNCLVSLEPYGDYVSVMNTDGTID